MASPRSPGGASTSTATLNISGNLLQSLLPILRVETSPSIAFISTVFKVKMLTDGIVSSKSSYVCEGDICTELVIGAVCSTNGRLRVEVMVEHGQSPLFPSDRTINLRN